ncbi:hypothetical protein OG223_41340 [Streptomyces sp. NBC_01478]|uniref:hypothetical protein n=1 Tax=Streptomyces sp. NBC_01478 TaxID=2903882 RepID=UPI002E348C3E|nr:hypothetical protein [Streptomyces sp. NBC_01478]
MTPMLTDMSADRLDALIKHPFHRENGERLIGFIKDLRECHSAEDFVTFQRQLLQATLAVNLARAERSRVIKRLRKRQLLPADAPDLVVGDPHDLDDWRLEADALERVARQLRSVGDAMAWRAFRYDRRYIFALRRNESPGPMTLNKKGTLHEIQFVEKQWNENGRFALLHDITDCLRIGDVTVFHDRQKGEQDVYLYELKTNPRRRESVQLTRTRLAAEALHIGGPLPGPDKAVLIDTGVPYTTHLSALSDAFAQAHQNGLKTMRVPGQRGLLAFDIVAAGNKWGEHERGRQFHAAYAALLRRMRLTGQKICFGSGDSAARNTMAPPWGIYPLQPAQCAGLIADVLVFTVTLSSDNFIEELGKQGLDAQWVLPSGAEMGPAQPVVTIQGHGRQVTMARAGLEQLLLELTDLQSWARGMDRLLQEGAAGWQPWPYFTEEHKVWV